MYRHCFIFIQHLYAYKHIFDKEIWCSNFYISMVNKLLISVYILGFFNPGGWMDGKTVNQCIYFNGFSFIFGDSLQYVKFKLFRIFLIFLHNLFDNCFIISYHLSFNYLLFILCVLDLLFFLYAYKNFICVCILVLYFPSLLSFYSWLQVFFLNLHFFKLENY